MIEIKGEIVQVRKAEKSLDLCNHKWTSESIFENPPQRKQKTSNLSEDESTANVLSTNVVN